MKITAFTISMLAVSNALAGTCSIEIDTVDYYPKYRVIQNGKKDSLKIDKYTYFGDFLGIYTVYDPNVILQKESDCQQKLLDTISAVKTLRDDKREINWVLKNDGKNSKSSDWLVNFDTTFEPYCSFYSSISKEMRISMRKYIGLSSFDERKFNECIICFYNHNNYRSLGNSEGLKLSEMWSFVNNRKIITTAHGIILKEDDRYKWLYLSDHQEKLRWPTMTNDKAHDDRINSMIKEKKKLGAIDSIKAFRK